MARQIIRTRRPGVFAVSVCAAFVTAPAAAALTPTSLGLSATPNPAAYGQAVTLTASVTPPSASGKVTFYDGVAVLGFATLSNGSAILTPRSLASGPHALHAFYAGAATYATSTSSAIQQTVRSIAQAGFNPAYSLAAGANPQALALADFNGDGHTDIAVANYAAGSIGVISGNGDGSFHSAVSYTVALNPAAIVSGDFNGDGKIDLAVANAGADSISVLMGNGDGTFQAAVSYPAGSTPCSIASADFNNDGIVDLAVANCGDGTAGIYLGQANGAFATAVPYTSGNVPASIAIGDFDGDGNADLVVANAADGTIAMLKGKGDGTFQAAMTYPTTNYPLSLAVADLNGDGKPDLVAAGVTNAAVLLNNGAGAFLTAVTYSAGDEPYSVAVADFTGDGIPDLMFADTAGNAVTLLAGKGDGTFQTAAAGAWLAGNAPAFVASADFNGDGIPDLAVADDGGGISILTGAAPAVLTMNCLVPATSPLVDLDTWSAPCSLINGTPPYSWSVTSGTLPPGIFLSANTGATVTVKGTPVATGPYSFVVTATDSGSPAESASQTFSGTVSATSTPAIASLSPASVTAGSAGFTLRVNGTDFLSGAIVKWNGAPLATTFVSANEVTASVTAGAIAAATSASITVANPDGGTSGAATFTVSAASSGGGSSGGGSSGGGSSGAGSSGGGSSAGGSSGGGGSPGGGGASSGGGGTSSIALSASSLSFTWTTGSAVPAAQNVAVFTGFSSGTFSTNVETVSGVGWLHASPASGKTPGFMSVSLDSTVLASLSPQTYSGFVYILGASGAVKLPVALTVSAPAATTGGSISVAPASILLAATTSATPRITQIAVLNPGSAAGYSASIASSNSGWLKIVAGGSGSATSTVPGAVLLSADPSVSGPGVFQASVQITAGSHAFTVPVTFAVSSGSSVVTLSQTAISLSATGQQTVAVATSSSAAVNWTAATSAAWLRVSPASGQASASSPGSATISVNPAALQAGASFGSVTFTSPGAIDGPQTVTVFLTAGASSIGASSIGASSSTSPGVTLSGSTPQQITVSDTSGTPAGFAAIAATSDGGAWLTVTPAVGVPKNGAAVVTVTANPATAGAGTHQGVVAVGFDDGSVQTVPVTLTSSGESCKPSTLRLSASGTAAGSAQAGVPVAIGVNVTDDCGNAAAPSTTAVVASFTNGDPAVNLVYTGTGSGGGAWQAAWIPNATSTAMQIEITAAQGSLTPALLILPFSVTPASSGGPGAPTAILNAASSTDAQVVAPGSYVAIYGAQMAATGYGLATTTPFSTTLDGTQVLLGGQPMPLFYASPTQINALVPQSLAPNTVAQLVIQNGSTISAPVPVVVTQYQPGIYSQNQAGTGQGSIEISGTALLAAPASSNSRPAQGGTDYIAIYCTGLGPVKGQDGEAPPADGDPANYPPLYQTVAPVSVTIGGVNAPVVFSGLTPTLVGLYQVDAQVPAGAPAGDAVPVVVSVTDPSSGAVSQSNIVTIAVQ